MIDTQTIDFGILVLAGLFLLVGLILFFRGLVGRDPASLYGVQRQVARRAAYMRLLQGAGLIGVAAILFVAYLSFQGNNSFLPTSPDETVATMTATSAPPTQLQEVVRTVPLEEPELVATQELTLPQVTVMPTDTPVPPEPTAETFAAEPTPEPTLAPTDAPTETPLPYDATVSVIGGLNMRDAPNGNLILLLDDGQPINLLDGREAAGAYMWQQVMTLDGVSGWVVEQFLQLAE